MSSESINASPFRPATGQIRILTLLFFAVTRVGILPLILDFRDNEVLYFKWSLVIREGSFPVGDLLYQYPPGAGLLFLLIEEWPGTFHQAFTLAVLLADIAIFVLLFSRAGWQGKSWRGPWAWIICGAMSGSLMYERFDIVPALFAVLALLYMSRPIVSGGLIAVGAMLKVWPILMVFAVRRDQLTKVLTGVLAGAVTLVVIAIATADSALSFVSGQSSRGLQIEANLAAPLLIADQLGLLSAESVDRYGSTELDAPYAGLVAWVGIATAVVMLGLLAIQRLRGKLNLIPGPDVALAALLVFVAFNRVNSPQFFIWVGAIAAVTLLDERSRMLVPVALMFGSFLPVTQYIGNFYWALQAQTPESVSLQVVRSVLAIASAFLAWWFVVSRKPYRDVNSSKARI